MSHSQIRQAISAELLKGLRDEDLADLIVLAVRSGRGNDKARVSCLRAVAREISRRAEDIACMMEEQDLVGVEPFLPTECRRLRDRLDSVSRQVEQGKSAYRARQALNALAELRVSIDRLHAKVST